MAAVQPVDIEKPDTTERAERTVEDSEIDGTDIMARLDVIETTHSKALNNITERLDKLEKEVGGLLEKTDSLQATDKVDDINELVAKIQEIETDMEKLGQITDKLIDDKESRETHLDVRIAKSKKRVKIGMYKKSDLIFKIVSSIE